MPNYRRPEITGGTYFITQVTYQRQPWLCREIGRHALRTAIKHQIPAESGKSAICGSVDFGNI